MNAAREAVLAAARATIGQGDPQLDGRPVPTDCSGYIRAVYTRAGVDLFSEGQPSDNGVRAIVRFIERHGLRHRRNVAAAGDLVFFDNSYDRNGDRRLNDRFTHVGLVEEVLPDGTMLIIHASNHGIVREPMNLLKPHDATDANGRMINAPLRRKAAHDTTRTPRLMSELFAGFGRVVQPLLLRRSQDPRTSRDSSPRTIHGALGTAGGDPVRSRGMGLSRLGGESVPGAQAEGLRSVALPRGLFRHHRDQLDLLPPGRAEGGA
jgi:hypothetical protein